MSVDHRVIQHRKGVVRDRHSKEIGGRVIEELRMFFYSGAEAIETPPITTPSAPDTAPDGRENGE